MTFFKSFRDQWKANALISHLEFAKAKFQPNDLVSASTHIEKAFAAVEKMKETQTTYAISREGWLYAAGLCLELSNSLTSVAQHQLAHKCFFMYEWCLWNEDSLEGGGVLSTVRASLSPAGQTLKGKRETAEPIYRRDTADARVRAAIDKKLVEVDLSDLELTELPSALRTMAGLQSFSISGNQIASLPDWVGDLSGLQSLDISGNPITNLPSSLKRLGGLRSLSLCRAPITSLPEGLCELRTLEELFIYENQLTSLPESIGNLIALKTLSAGNNQLTQLPDSIGKLVKLELLYIDHNSITSLPESLGRLSNLHTLDVSGNPLTGPSERFGALAKLLEGQF